jgi:hypothetical protein
MTAPTLTGHETDMVPTDASHRRQLGVGHMSLQLTVVVLTIATAVIHLSLGGLLFTLNAVGYVTFAIALVVPGPLGRNRWLVRVGLIGFTAATIAGWLVFGARFPLAYLDKAIEVALIALVVVELWWIDRWPGGIARQVRSLVSGLAGSLAARR